MCDNDILIARKEGDTVKAVHIDGDAADFERQNNRVKERKASEAAKRREEAAYQKYCQELKAAMEKAQREKRKRQVQAGLALALSVGALMAMTLAGLMHTVVGMVFIAGAAAACGLKAGRCC